jgi:hypothetical protein
MTPFMLSIAPRSRHFSAHQAPLANPDIRASLIPSPKLPPMDLQVLAHAVGAISPPAVAVAVPQLSLGRRGALSAM